MPTITEIATWAGQIGLFSIGVAAVSYVCKSIWEARLARNNVRFASLYDEQWDSLKVMYAGVSKLSRALAGATDSSRPPAECLRVAWVEYMAFLSVVEDRRAFPPTKLMEAIDRLFEDARTALYAIGDYWKPTRRDEPVDDQIKLQEEKRKEIERNIRRTLQTEQISWC